jgi:Flp pilus assembly protein TadG
MARVTRRRAGQRGAASVEALLLVPFFFIVWGCVFFVHRTFDRKLVVSEAARSCAWERMTSGCNAPASAGCQLAAAPTPSDEQLEGSRASIVQIETLFQRFTVDFRARFGPAFRPLFAAAGEVRVARPASIGGGQVAVGTTLSAMCNETGNPETVAAIARDSYCSQTPWCP